LGKFFDGAQELEGQGVRLAWVVFLRAVGS